MGSTNLLPDGAASAKTIELLRNMLIRESDDELYLLSAVSPAWLRPGRMGVFARPDRHGEGGRFANQRPERLPSPRIAGRNHEVCARMSAKLMTRENVSP